MHRFKNSYEIKHAGHGADGDSDSDSSSGAGKRKPIQDGFDDDDDMMNFLLDPFAAQPQPDKRTAEMEALRKRQAEVLTPACVRESMSVCQQEVVPVGAVL